MTRRPWLIAAATLVMALCAGTTAAQDDVAGQAGEIPSYMLLEPMVAIRLESLSSASRMIEDGLVGSGVDVSRQACLGRIVSAFFLDSLDGIDLDRPVDYFLLSNDPPDSLPEPAVVIPLKDGGVRELMAALRRKYRDVGGGSIKICSGPLDGVSVDPLYVAMAGGNAMVSPDIDPIRWMAYHLKSHTLPSAKPHRDYPVSLSANGPLLGLFMELLASLDKDAVSEEATAGNTLLHIRELGVFFSQFSRIDLAVSAAMNRWELSTRLAPVPGGDMDACVSSLLPPSAALAAAMPRIAPKRCASDLAGLIEALPKSNRRWLASLSDNTRLVGLGIAPCVFDLDETIRPHLADASFSSFVIDQAAGRIGVVSATELKSPSAVEAALENYFSSNGLSQANARIRRVVQTDRLGCRIHAYNVPQSLSPSSGAGMGQTSAAVSYLLGLNHVELAVADGRLIVARGASGLIDPWLEDDGAPRSSETLATLAAPMGSVPDGETLLGGGSAAPMSIVTRLIQSIPDMRDILPLLPRNGSGMSWRMTKGEGSVLFDLRLYSNEIIAFNRMRNINSSTMQDFLSQLVLRHFQQTADEASRRDQLKEKARSLRAKDSLR